MKAKNIALLVCFIFVGFYQGVAGAEQAQGTAEDTVSRFYAWYLDKEDSQAFPVLDSKIYDYVCKSTIQRLRADYKSNKLADVDYFTKVQDFDPGDWKSHTAIAKAVISNGIARVPVIFGSSDRVKVLVYLKQQNDVWRIIKVESN
jgi:hypothetical protein